MHNVRDVAANAASLFVATILSVMGGWHLAIGTLCGFIVIDYAAAVIACKIRKIPWDWDKSICGFWRKLMYFVVIIFAATVDLLMQCVGMDTGGKVRLSFLLMLNAHEISSITRTIGLCGFTIPEILKQIIETMKKGGSK